MIDNKQETTEQPKPERIIALGEVFNPFDPERNKVEHAKRRLSLGETITDYGLFMQGMLEINDNLTIPIDVSAIDLRKRFEGEIYKGTRGSFLTPFNPDLGYGISFEDFTPEGRADKLTRLKSELGKKIDLSINPLYLQVESANNVGETAKFPTQIIQLVRRLRLFVKAGEMQLESKPLHFGLKDGYLRFVHVYPADTGPLATPSRIFTTGEDFWLNLPDDPEKLKQIRMQFVLAEEESEKVK